MEEYWGATKEAVIENIGNPQETNTNEESGLEELTFVFTAKQDFQPIKEVTYGFHQDSLVIISTGYDFNEKLFKQYELYHKSLEEDWTKRLKSDPLKPTEKDDEENIITIWNLKNSEILLYFNNDATDPQLVVVQTYKPAN
jgi:hypothetical protein